MRWMPLPLLAALSCTSSHLSPRPLPPLVAATPAKPAPVVAHALRLDPGDHWAWDVQLGGVSIGRAELVVGERDVRSRFQTSKLASAFATVRAEDVTVLDRAAAVPVAATEQLDLDGDHDARTTSFTGTARHTVHTALGWLRAWASADAQAATLVVEHLGADYTVEVARPAPERLDDAPALRIDGVVRGAPRPVALTLWLSDDARRAPVRAVIASGDIRVVAQLVDD
jgi:hypothetical protein